MYLLGSYTFLVILIRYVPYPGGGEKWGGNGVGDDSYSFGFDGEALWTGGRKTVVLARSKGETGSNSSQQVLNTSSTPSKIVTGCPIRKGDVLGCALDLTIPLITFTFNGKLVPGSFTDFNLDGMFFPVISCSSKLRYI